MTTLIIGSTAMWNLGFSHREPDDFDVFTDTPDSFESEGFDPFWHDSFYEWLGDTTLRSATLDELYTIKLSHSYWDLKNGSWDKHAYDLVELKRAGAKVDLKLHKLLYGVWESQHGRKQVDLTQEADEFFADAVKRRYDHDSIHYSVAYGDVPMYEHILKDGHSVDVDPKKMWALSHKDLVRLFREEILATALERIVIPRNYQCSPGAAYLWALKRTATSLTKGKSARFIMDNFEEFRTPDSDYVERHKSKSHLLIPLEN
jgi:hypothetical protein